MTPLSLLQRASGKSPAYVARRAFEEAGRRIRGPVLRRRIASRDLSRLAAEAGARSLEEMWRGRPPVCGSEADLARIGELHASRLPDARRRLSDAVERLLLGEVDLLGSGPVRLPEPVDWHRDFKSGARWPLVPAERIDPQGLPEPADVKVPWELSRCGALVVLARGWVVLRDRRCAEAAGRRLAGWLDANPPGMGVNWASAMDAALRAVSWTWMLALTAGAPLPEGLRERTLASLHAHGLWIEANLERGEVRGNHFVAGALGLACVGYLFAGTTEGERWRAAGARFLHEEIALQVGEDGVDFEGSVPYHRLVLEMFLVGMRLMELSGVAVSAAFRGRIIAMLEFVRAYVTPDGLSPVVGDADDGRALALGEADLRDHRALLSTGAVLFRRADLKAAAGGFREDSLWLLGPDALDAWGALPAAADEATSRGFPEAGFYVLRSPSQYLFVDAGPVGTRGLGGHGHNDCLSFEWHAEGKPLLTDSGTFVYTASRAERNAFRSTAYHNAIRVDGEEINRFASPLALFALRDDARPRDVRASLDGPAPSLEASHTGYLRLADPVLVTRRFALAEEGGKRTLSIRDRLDGAGTHVVEIFFHAAPGARAVRSPDGSAAFEWEDGRRLSIRSDAEVEWTAGEGWFSPSYGVRIARPFWVASTRRKLPWTIGWSLSLEP